MIRLGTLISMAGLAMLALGPAHAQQQPKPKYDELLEAITHADCQRSETEDFMRFVCRDSGAIWYFTRQGGPAHPAYQAFPAWQRSNEMPDLKGAFSSGDDTKPGDTSDQIRVHTQAVRDWRDTIFETWRKTQPHVR